MSWTTFNPIGTKILVRLHVKRSHYGVIEMPDDYRKQQETADVIAVGPRAPRELQPGQVVILGKWNGRQIEAPDHDPDGEYWVLDADHSKPVPHVPDVYGILEIADSKELLRVGADVPKARAV